MKQRIKVLGARAGLCPESMGTQEPDCRWETVREGSGGGTGLASSGCIWSARGGAQRGRAHPARSIPQLSSGGGGRGAGHLPALTAHPHPPPPVVLVLPSPGHQPLVASQPVLLRAQPRLPVSHLDDGWRTPLARLLVPCLHPTSSCLRACPSRC